MPRLLSLWLAVAMLAAADDDPTTRSGHCPRPPSNWPSPFGPPQPPPAILLSRA